MTISIKTLSLFALTISLTIAIPNAGFTQDTNTPPAKEKPSKKAAKAEPKAEPKAVTFSAKIAAVDKVARTITLDDRAKHVLQISSDTLITKDGKPAIFADGAIGEAANGTYKKSEDGKLSALLLNFGEKPKAAKPVSKPKKTKPEATNAPAAVSAPVVPVPPTAPAVPSTNVVQ